jgi:hypothetical protein
METQLHSFLFITGHFLRWTLLVIFLGCTVEVFRRVQADGWGWTPETQSSFSYKSFRSGITQIPRDLTICPSGPDLWGSVNSLVGDQQVASPVPVPVCRVCFMMLAEFWQRPWTVQVLCTFGPTFFTQRPWPKIFKTEFLQLCRW